MFRQISIALIILILLSGCYCRNYRRGSSSVRFLTTVKSYDCFIGNMDTCSGMGIKNLLGTVYTADPYFQLREVRKENGLDHTGISFDSHFLIGLRLESLYSIGRYPGPLIGIGIDYSYAEYTVAFKHSSFATIQETVCTHRMNLSFNVVTWITPRMIGYISLQPGYAPSKLNNGFFI